MVLQQTTLMTLLQSQLDVGTNGPVVCSHGPEDAGLDLCRLVIKHRVFAELFQALDICVNVKSMGAGLVTIENTDNRRQELIKTIEGALPQQAHEGRSPQMRGRLQFASGNVFGRVAKSALAAVTNHAYHGESVALDASTRLALTMHRHLLERVVPENFIRNAANASSCDACFEKQSEDIFAGIVQFSCA